MLIQVITTGEHVSGEARLDNKHNFNVRGLVTASNEFTTPDGSLITADNIVITEANVGKVRRGFQRYLSTLTGIKQLLEFGNDLLIHYNSDKLAYASGGSPDWNEYSTAMTHTDGWLKHQEAQASIFILTDNGVYKLDDVENEPAAAGGIIATSGDTEAYGDGIFLSDQYQVAYRVLWGIRDANDYVISGVPSERLIFRNNDGVAEGVTLTIDIPTGVTTSHFYQVYRSEQVALSSEPDDELRLIFEGNPTSGDLTNGYVTVNDDTDDSQRGADLYTNVSQRGIENAYYPPPKCTDLAWWQSRMFYANTSTFQEYRLDLINVGTPGLVVGDTITIGGITYTAALVEDENNDEFYCPGGSPYVAPSYAIESVAQSLVRVINRSSNSVVEARYLSGFNDYPGQIKLRAKTVTQAAFAVTSSNSNPWSPALPSSGTNESSSNETRQNRVYFSLINQPEAVPLANYFDVGGRKDPIIRLYAQQDFLYAFKTDGIWRISNTTRGNAVRVATARLKAPRSIGLIRNNLLAFCDQGVVAVTNTGVDDNISTNIERDLVKLTDDSYTSFETATHACSYESERQYIVWTVSDPTDTIADQAYVLNPVLGAWTRWVRDATTSLVRQYDNKLYIADETQVYVERKDFTNDDYADNQYNVTISSSDGTTVNIADGSDVEPYMTLVQGDNEGFIESTAGSPNTILTLDNTYSWSAGAAIVYTPITGIIKIAKEHCGYPMDYKYFYKLTLFFTRQIVTEQITVKWTTDQYGATEVTYTNDQIQGLYGNTVYGEINYGGEAGVALPITFPVPRNVSAGRWLDIEFTHRQSFRPFGYSGYSLLWESIGDASK